MGTAKVDIKSIFGKAAAVCRHRGSVRPTCRRRAQGDPELRAEVESLLRATGEAGPFLGERGPAPAATTDGPVSEGCCWRGGASLFTPTEE